MSMPEKVLWSNCSAPPLPTAAYYLSWKTPSSLDSGDHFANKVARSWLVHSAFQAGHNMTGGPSNQGTVTGLASFHWPRVDTFLVLESMYMSEQLS